MKYWPFFYLYKSFASKTLKKLHISLSVFCILCYHIYCCNLMQIVCNLFFVFQVVLWKDKATWGREEAPVGSEWARGFLNPRLGVQEERLLSLGQRRRYCQALQNQVRNMRALHQICLQFINYFQLNNCEKAKIDIQRKITFWVKKDCPITLQTDF